MSDEKKVRVLYEIPKLEDKEGMVHVIIPEGTEVLDTTAHLKLKLTMEPFPVKVPKELLWEPPHEWEEYEDE